MRLFVASETFDLEGWTAIDYLPTSEFGTHARRASKTRTLDGGVAVYDSGYSSGDLTFAIRFRKSLSIDATLKRLVELYSQITVSTRDGVYRAIPSYEDGPGVAGVLNLSITERLT